MNTIRHKIFVRGKIILLAVIIFFLTTSQTLNDVKYYARYVDVANGKFYDADFYITMNLHENLASQNYVTPDVLLSNQTYLDQVNAAASIWNNLSGSFFNFTIGTSLLPTGYPIGVDENPAVNVIGFDNGTVLPLFDLSSSNNNDRTAAFTYYWYDNSNCAVWSDPLLRGADIAINKFAPWGLIGDADCPTASTITTKFIDFESVILHELGHAAGIRHHITSTPTDLHVMSKNLFTKKCRRTLLDKDIFAMVRLYGGLDTGQNSSILCSDFDQSPHGGLEIRDEDVVSGGGGNPLLCDDDDITINYNSYYIHGSHPYREYYTISASNSITTSGQININPNTFFLGSTPIQVWTAGSFIELNEGFETHDGIIWTALIADCVSERLAGKTNDFQNTAAQSAELIEKNAPSASQEVNKYNNDFSVTPSSSRGVFTLQLETAYAATVSIYNVLGQLVYRSAISNPQSLIDLSFQPKGIYFIQAKSADKVFTEKIILQ